MDLKQTIIEKAAEHITDPKIFLYLAYLWYLSKLTNKLFSVTQGLSSRIDRVEEKVEKKFDQLSTAINRLSELLVQLINPAQTSRLENYDNEDTRSAVRGKLHSAGDRMPPSRRKIASDPGAQRRNERER